MENPSDDVDLSDAVLRYINQMLMEEDMEDKAYMLQESLDLQAKEKSFYDALASPPPTTTTTTDPHPRPRHQQPTASIWNFNKGVEEFQHYYNNGNGGIEKGNFNKGVEEFAAIENKKGNGNGGGVENSRGRKNRIEEDAVVEEERSTKLAAVYLESTIRSDEFDIVLLHSMGEGQTVMAAFRDKLKSRPLPQLKRGKKQQQANKLIDLRTLLIHCAQAVAADDHRTGNQLLKRIREHSSPFGDGTQRLAYCFADGLEARLAGTGSQVYKSLVNKRTSAVDFLKAYHLYLASCPFRKMSSLASNRMIRSRASAATRIHVIDFGILYGFQWPTFIQRLAKEREGGPPVTLRITGIEFPQPGFRPATQVEETGRRLSEYANMFSVPFEFIAVAKKWETVTLQDLKIQEGEFVVVNCIYRSKNLVDESLAVESSRTLVLNLIRSINPDVFVHGIVNGAYSAPFFVTRFREALFHFSALFDMLETVVPKEIPERALIEKEIFGKEALNVVACEGWERVERPETYKQWQVRSLRAGFRQIAFDRGIMKMVRDKVRTSYHKDFLIDEDSHWLLLGWKGRIIYALSCWTPL